MGSLNGQHRNFVCLPCVYSDRTALCMADSRECKEEQKWDVGELQPLNLMPVWMLWQRSEHNTKRRNAEAGDILAENEKRCVECTCGCTQVRSTYQPMMLAEVIVRFLDGCAAELDFGENYQKDKRFSCLSSFTGEKATIQWLRDYLSDTLKYSRERAESTPRCGWVQRTRLDRMAGAYGHLVLRMDMLLASDPEKGELAELQVSGEINYQKEVERICEQEGHVWKETMQTAKSGNQRLGYVKDAINFRCCIGRKEYLYDKV